MQDPEREALRAAVEFLHKCQVTYVHGEAVTVTSGSVTIERDVAVFALRGDQAPAPLAYAWSDLAPSAPNETNVDHRVVLHSNAAKSPQHAVGGFYLVQSPRIGLSIGHDTAIG